MKLPLSWLKEFVTIDASVEELSRRLTMAGLEVENIEHSAPTFDGVLIAKVLNDPALLKSLAASAKPEESGE